MFPRQCPRCKSSDIHRSRRRGPFERAMLRPLLLRPYRCWSCCRRHYGSTLRRSRASLADSCSAFLGGVRRLAFLVSILN